MRQVLAINKAVADETRLRALMMLRDGELCVCQIIEALGLAPSTVSKHMTILHDAGLIERRKEGKWHYYRWAGRSAPLPVRRALKWLDEALGDEAAILRDRDTLCCVTAKDREESACCYRA